MSAEASRFPYFDEPFIAFAHRGGFSTGVPIELRDSMRAFQAAWSHGYRYLETDVHVTSDGVLIAFHDHDLGPVTDGVGKIAELPWSEVRRARIGGTEEIVLFDDLIEAFPEARFNIDLKAPGAVAPLAEALRRHDANERVCVASFSGKHLRAFRKMTDGTVATSAPPFEAGVFSLLRPVRAWWPLNAQAFQMPPHDERTNIRLLDRRVVEAAHRRGRHVHVWTINDRPEMERLIELGVDGIITDNLEELKAVLTERGMWRGNA